MVTDTLDKVHKAVCQDFAGYARFPIGTVVCLKESVSADRNTAKVRGYCHIASGGLSLDKPLDGIRYWNVDDVVEY